MKILIFLLCLLLAGCSSVPEQQPPTTEATLSPETTFPAAVPETTVPVIIPEATDAPDPIRQRISGMSLEERVGQLFLARCDDSVALEDIEAYHLGGFVLFAGDFEGQTPDSLRRKLESYQAAAKTPLLLAVDEEGGTVTRISRYSAFRDTPFRSPRSLYSGGGMEAVLLCEKEKSQLLKDLGLNVNLGPVCDITTEPSAFMYQRSLGQPQQITSEYVRDAVRQMGSSGIGSCLKHFPGYGNNTDTHTGIAVDSRSLSRLEEFDLCPFRAGIAAGCDAILISHTIVQDLDPELPASLSPTVHTYLRRNLGFSGVILTDDLVMQAITDVYGAGEAAVLAVLSGNDLLCSTDYRTQYEAVLTAVLEGRIDIDTLNNAVRNVLEWKEELGLI